MTGRCALITGSVQGLGLAAARRFAAAGCRIVLHGLANDDTAAALCREIAATYQTRAIFSNADLQQVSEIERLMADAEEAFGGVDILVNNAVVRHASPIEQFPTGAWDESLAVNLSAAFHTIRLALPRMKAQNWGRIINVSSIYGLTAAPGRAAYVTTKTALIGLTRAVALETASHDITCNAICPGTARTPVHEETVRTLMTAHGLAQADAEAHVLAGKQPTGRFIEPAGVAALMVFLCGPDARDITGAALPIDGAAEAR